MLLVEVLVRDMASCLVRNTWVVVMFTSNNSILSIFKFSCLFSGNQLSTVSFARLSYTMSGQSPRRPPEVAIGVANGELGMFQD